MIRSLCSYNYPRQAIGGTPKNTDIHVNWHRYLDPDLYKTIPHICHGSHGYTRVNFFLAGVKFYRFNAKNWHFRQNLREKLAFFLHI